jgi:hypothetical protein
MIKGTLLPILFSLSFIMADQTKLQDILSAKSPIGIEAYLFLEDFGDHYCLQIVNSVKMKPSIYLSEKMEKLKQFTKDTIATSASFLLLKKQSQIILYIKKSKEKIILKYNKKNTEFYKYFKNSTYLKNKRDSLATINVSAKNMFVAEIRKSQLQNKMWEMDPSDFIESVEKILIKIPMGASSQEGL